MIAAGMILPQMVWAGGKKQKATPERPNIIFILADDMGYGDLSCYGSQYVKTPNIDRLAATGTRFNQCYAGSGISSPSRCSLMTGRNTGNTRIRDNMCTAGGITGIKVNPKGDTTIVRRANLLPEDTTIATLIGTAGYRTCLVNKWHLDGYDKGASPNHRGFDEFYGWTISTVHSNSPYYYPYYRFHGDSLIHIEENANGQHALHNNDLSVNDAIAFVNRNRKNPFFLYLAFDAPHEPYNIDQTAIIGITPGYSGQGQVNHVLTVYNMYYSGNRELERGSNGFSFYKRRQVVVTAEDHINDGTKYARGIALYDSNNNFVEMIASMTYYSSAISVTDKWPDSNSSEYYYFGKNISNGKYKIVPVCQVQGTSEWIPMLESDRYYIEMTVSGNTATLVDHPLNDLTSTNFEFTGDHRVGAAEQCHVTVQNNSDDRFSGKLFLYVSNEQIDEYGEYTTVVEAEIPAHGSKVVTFNFTPQNAGTKTAQLSLYDSSMGGSKIPGTGSVTIAAAPAVVPMNLSVVIEATNAVDGIIYDSHARFKVDVTNNADGEFNRYLLAPLFIVENGSGTMVTYQQTTLRIPAHETVTLYYDFDNLAYGSTYALNIYGRNENEQTVNLVEPGHSVYYQVQRGLVTWDGTSMVGNSGPASSNIIAALTLRAPARHPPARANVVVIKVFIIV